MGVIGIHGLRSFALVRLNDSCHALDKQLEPFSPALSPQFRQITPSILFSLTLSVRFDHHVLDSPDTSVMINLGGTKTLTLYLVRALSWSCHWLLQCCISAVCALLRDVVRDLDGQSVMR